MAEKLSREERLRRAIDSWVGTLAQVIGLVLLVYAILIDRFRTPALFPAATGLIFLRQVASRGDQDRKGE